MAAAPIAPRSSTPGSSKRPGNKSNQRRTIRKNEPFTTRADRMALAAGGAPAWAGGSHRCSGNSAVLASSPTVISATAAITEAGSWSSPQYLFS